MRKRQVLLGVAGVLLLAAPVLAQSVGTPGYVATSTAGARTWTGVQTFRDTAFKLTDNTTPTKVGLFELSGLTAGTNTFNLNSAASGTFSLLTSTLATNAPDVANSVWGVSGGMRFEGSTADSSETTVGAVDPTGTRTINFPNESGTVTLQTSGEVEAFAFYTLIDGGYVLGGTLTSTLADEVDVVVVDTTPSISDGDIQVCGYTSAVNKTALVKTCETLDVSGGANTYTTTATFVEITEIKSSSFVGLGGSGDETVAAAWEADATAILAATNAANHTASDFTAVGTPAGKYWAPQCLDLAGCAIGFGALTVSGFELTVVGRDGTTDLTFTDSATLNVAASGAFTAGAGDSIKFVHILANTEWAEVSRSNN